MEGEAAEFRVLAAKYKKRADKARLVVTKTFFSGLERRYTLLADVYEKEAQTLRNQHIRTATPDDDATDRRVDVEG